MSFREKWVSECGRVTLYQGDCMEVLKTMPDNSADSIISDPPYNTSGSVWRRGSRNKSKRAPIVIDNMDGQWNHSTIDTSSYQRVLKSFSSMALFHGIRQVITVEGFKMIDTFFIVKPTSPPRCRPGFCSSVELAEIYTRTDGGKRKYHGGFTTKNFWMGFPDNQRSTERANHPAQKSIEPMKILVNSLTLPDETVLDPFMGSGTTGVACVRTGRRFIGIEIDEHHFNTAKNRIQKELDKQAEMLFPAEAVL